MKVTLVITGIICLAAACLSGQDRQRTGEDRLHVFRSAEVLMEAGQDSAARVLYLAAVTGPDGTEITDSLTALMYHRIGTGYYNAAEDTLAMPYFRRSLALRDSLFRGPHNERAQVRTNMGMSMLYYGDPDSALLLIQEAIAMYEQVATPDSLFWLKSLNELGEHAIRREDFSLGLSSSYRAVELCERLDSVNSETKFVTYYRAARIFHDFDDQPQALSSATKALEAVSDDLPWKRALCHNLLGLIEGELGNTPGSRHHLMTSLSILGDGDDDLRADAHLYLAEHYAAVGNPRLRDQHDAMAYELYRQSGELRSYHSRTPLSRYAIESGDFAAAVGRLTESLDTLQKGAEDDRNFHRIAQIVNALFLRGRAYAGMENTGLALQDLERGFLLQDRLRRLTHDQNSRIYLNGYLRPEIDLAVRLSYERYLHSGQSRHLWQAYRLSERARAFSLLASLHKEKGDQQERKLQQSIAELERAVSRGQSTAKSELEALRIKLARLRSSRPRIMQQALELDSAKLVAYLAERKTSLLEYHLSDSLQLAFVLTPGGKLRVVELPIDATLQKRIVAWVASISDSQFRRKSLRPTEIQQGLDSLFLTNGREIVRQLFPAELRRALPSPGPLCIIPDGSLSYLPFAALPLDGATGWPLDYRRLTYLQDSYEISYAYSGAYLSRFTDTLYRDEYANDLVAFAPSFGTDLLPAAVRAAVGGEPLAPLAFNQEEARAITTLITNSKLYCGPQANRERFLRETGNSRILHLSTHGKVDSRNPELSFVAFHQPDDRLEDSELLYYNDLSSLRIQSELAVLSACETSLGQLAPGEAPLSFASALAAAGARSTLTTLWQVDDRATKQLMVEFYRQLAAGRDRLSALVAAQDSLRSSDYFHPYYWGAPTLYGRTHPIPLASGTYSASTAYPWSFMSVAALALICLFSFFHYRS